ncbi:T9SS type A sorting domain-containing protein [Flavobacterium hauense]
MKNLLLFAFVALSFSANAQFTVWEDDFNDGTITDWTRVDINGDGQSWQANRNLQQTESGAIDISTLGTHNVMAVYGIDMVTGEQLIGKEGFVGYDHEWVKSPSIDLSFYTGTTQLVINAQTMIYDASSELYVYASTSPEQESFVVIDTLNIIREPLGSVDEQFRDYTVDISEYAGEDQFYFAIVTDKFGLFLGHEIDNVKITATEVVTGLDDLKKTATKIEQNPVTETLNLQLGDAALNSQNLNIKIYNISGTLVMESEYTETGITVGELSNGMYFVELSGDNVVERLKFIKK